MPLITRLPGCALSMRVLCHPGLQQRNQFEGLSCWFKLSADPIGDAPALDHPPTSSLDRHFIIPSTLPARPLLELCMLEPMAKSANLAESAFWPAGGPGVPCAMAIGTTPTKCLRISPDPLAPLDHLADPG